MNNPSKFKDRGKKTNEKMTEDALRDFQNTQGNEMPWEVGKNDKEYMERERTFFKDWIKREIKMTYKRSMTLESKSDRTPLKA